MPIRPATVLIAAHSDSFAGVLADQSNLALREAALAVLA